ncbi:MAG TPA: NHLP family bacteriocin export ABC transporter peptidase/permease/ATPase subunit [Vicinamibacterales bacterium]|nr:NHLP family bacteriocin export ABC transporter peptidase/permease/ATPase subunit [Vicinamibacterales bacterium]
MAEEAAVPAEQPKQFKKAPNKRVRTPTILQMEAVECGAAALSHILAYYGRWAPLEELRHECGVSRDGSKANNLMKAARKYNLDSKGYKYDDIEKLYEVELPVIIFWNFNHFVTLEGFKGDIVFLNDPAQGPRKVTLAEFDGSYSGIVLTFKPNKDFKKGGASPKMMPALRRRLVGSESALLYVVLCGLLLVIPGLVIPTFTRIFIDDYMVGGQDWMIKFLLGAMATTIAVQGVLQWLQHYYLLRLETKLALTTSSKFFMHMLRLPTSYFGQRFAGEIGSRVGINDKVAKIVSGKLATTVIDTTMTIFYAGLMCLYSVSLTVIVISISMLNVLAVQLASRLRTDASRKLGQDKGKLMGTAMNGLQMIETIKATGSDSEFFSRWAGYYAKTVNGEQFLQVLGNVAGAVPPLVDTLSTATVLVLGGLKVMNGEMTVGMLVAYQTLLSSFTRPLTSFVTFGSTLQELTSDMNRLDDVTRYPEDPQYAQTRETLKDAPKVVKLSGRVELKDVTFGYSPLEPPLIEKFNLKVEPGRRVALVGGSGSGKSTVAKLVSGLFEPWAGDVIFDGVPRKRLPRELIVNSLAVVDQDLFLFGGSVAENVTMWDTTIAANRVATACKDAAIAEVIEGREDGYRSRVAEGGGNFSGGQCQRLEISRALVGEPTIVVMDEATSALDPATEVHIDESMRRRGCTTIVIAHRLSTIRDADEIVVMEKGKIVQRGTHEEMKDIDGPYKRLIAH